MVDEVLICPICGHHNPPKARFCQNDGVPLEEGDPEDPLVGRMVGDYCLKERIGEGGFGVVYRVVHRELETVHAVKILHPQFSANAHVAERFRREAEAAGKLRHDNVVHISDFGQAKGIGYYYIMEFLDGKTLKEALDEEEAFPPERILHIAEQVTSAMEKVHDLQIIHRDLKPENIFLMTNGSHDDHVKLVDFGIAKMLDAEGASLTRTGLSVGTPLYMSPEQARGLLKELDRRSDIYSWGIILFELLTYQPPFFSENPHDVVMLQIRGKPPRLSDTHPYRRFNQPIEAFFQRVLSKRPSERPSTMLALFEEFKPLILAPDAFYDLPGYGNSIDSENEAGEKSDSQLPIEPRSLRESPFAMSAPLDDELFSPGHTGERLFSREYSDGEVGVTSVDALASVEDFSEEEREDVSSLQDLEALGQEENLAPSALPFLQTHTNDSGSPEATLSAPNAEVMVLDEEDRDSQKHNIDDARHEGESAVALEMKDPKESSDHLDGLFDGLPSEEVESLRTSRSSAGNTSEVMLTGTASFATDPKALHSPLRRYSGPLLGGIVLLLFGIIFWASSQDKDKYETNPPTFRHTIYSDGGAHSKLDGSQPDTQSSKMPLPEKLSASPDSVPERSAPKQRSVRRRGRSKAVGKKKIYKLLVHIKPRATCYVGRSFQQKRRIGSSPCRVRGMYGETKYIWIKRRRYKTAMRIWTVSNNEVWMVTLRKIRRKRRPRTRRKPVVKRGGPPDRRKMDDIFGVTPNPFTKRKKPR